MKNAVMAAGTTDGGAVAKEEVVETDDESTGVSRRNTRPSLPSKMEHTNTCCRTGIVGMKPARGGRNMVP